MDSQDADLPDYPYPEEDSPSKSERKRQMLALQDLGERLVTLSSADLAQILINDDRLREAIDAARRITARGGLRRQLQYIGKLMRATDPEPIRQSLAALDQRHASSVTHLHRIEAARDQLVERGDDALGGILETWPNAEPAFLRQWHRQLERENQKGQSKAHLRKLFRYFSELEDSASSDSSELV